MVTTQATIYLHNYRQLQRLCLPNLRPGQQLRRPRPRQGLRGRLWLPPGGPLAQLQRRGRAAQTKRQARPGQWGVHRYQP